MLKILQCRMDAEAYEYGGMKRSGKAGDRHRGPAGRLPRSEPRPRSRTGGFITTETITSIFAGFCGSVYMYFVRKGSRANPTCVDGVIHAL
jgi:hypothetical protein